MSLEIVIENKPNGICIIKPFGHLDTETYTIFENKIKPCLNPETKYMVLNMENVDYISSAGLNTIFNAKKTIESQGGNFILTNLQPQVKQVFEIIKALPKFAVFNSIEEADRYFDSIQKKEMEKQKRSGKK